MISTSNHKETTMARGKKRDPELQEILDGFARLRVGASIFIPGVSRADIETIRQPLIGMGVGVRIVKTDCDPRHGCAGVRLWRKKGEYDEL
jgi:hypothetical protein